MPAFSHFACPLFYSVPTDCVPFTSGFPFELPSQEKRPEGTSSRPAKPAGACGQTSLSRAGQECGQRCGPCQQGPAWVWGTFWGRLLGVQTAQGREGVSQENVRNAPCGSRPLRPLCSAGDQPLLRESLQAGWAPVISGNFETSALPHSPWFHGLILRVFPVSKF